MAKEVNKDVVIHQMHGKPLSPSDLDLEEDTVTMFFPRRVLLTLDDHRRVEFASGVQEVPVSLADHRYLALNGVRKHDGKKQDLRPPVTEELTEEHLEYIQGKGVPVANVEQANKYYANLLPEQRERFQIEFEAWKAKAGKETIFQSPSGKEQTQSSDQVDDQEDTQGDEQQAGDAQTTDASQQTGRKKRQPAAKAS